MARFDDIMNDLKALKDEGLRKATEAVEISRLKIEKMKVNQEIRENYERLGEIVYGGYKNAEDVSDVTKVLYEQLDDSFDKISDIYDAMTRIKALYGDAAETGEDDEDEDIEEYSEEEEEEEEPEAEEEPEVEEPIPEITEEVIEKKVKKIKAQKKKAEEEFID